MNHRANRPLTTVVQQEHGIALLSALFLVLVVALLGMTALHLAAQELDSVRAVRTDAVGLHLAEAGAEMVVGWMHAPESMPSPMLRDALTKREHGAGMGSSFFDSTGRSQFRGTSAQPDVLIDASYSEQDRLLNDPAQGWFRQAAGLGRVTSLKVYAPTRADLLCTVDVSAVGTNQLEHAARTVRVQLAAVPMPPLQVAVHASAMPAVGTSASPVSVHWGDVQVLGDAVVRAWSDVPARTALAPVTGYAYRDMPAREDRWHELRLGGEATVLEPSAYDHGLPLNVLHHQLPVPGLPVPRWDYADLKRLAQTHGTYYAVDHNGRLHQDGREMEAEGMTVDEALHSGSVGASHGLVFVDTLDQQPPHGDNLARLTIETPYAEGVFVVNAHVTWRPRGAGQSVPALSPPTGEVNAVATRVPVQLSNIHLNGVLAVAGNLAIENEVRAFGSVVADGVLTAVGDGLEVWFNHDARSGYYRGVPVVHVAPGTWRAL